jgi:hypothetical protein
MIRKLHWDYFLALESNLDNLSRYIDFHECNYAVYSIELGHLLLAACSETEVLLKQICTAFAPATKRRNIKDFQTIMLTYVPDIAQTKVELARHDLVLFPWKDVSTKIPAWWDGYNKVKHYRDKHYAEGNLKNTIECMAALYSTLILHYHIVLKKLPARTTVEMEKICFTDVDLFNFLNPASRSFSITGESWTREAGEKHRNSLIRI